MCGHHRPRGTAICLVICVCVFGGCSRNTQDRSRTDLPDLAPIHEAVLRHDVRGVEKEIRQGVSADVENRSGRITALQLASGCGYTDVMEILLENGADVNHRGVSGHTPLHCAAALGRYQAVEWLLQHGADPSARITSGETPLDLARANLQTVPFSAGVDWKRTCEIIQSSVTVR